MKRRYGVAVSAMILALQLGGVADAAEPSIAELEQIAALLDANDVQGMRSFLLLNPDLLQGDTDLARLLREYMEFSADLLEFVGIVPDPFEGEDETSQGIRAELAQVGAPDGPDGGSDPDPALY